jgi:cytochrome P450
LFFLVLLTILGLFLLFASTIARLFGYGALSHIPGPWLSKLSSLNLAFYDLTYSRNKKILEWHRRYGPVVCISPREVSVATLDGTRIIYGTTQGWSKSDYFDNFMGYNQRAVFATKSHRDHQKKRRLTSAFYQASTIYNLPELEEFIHNRCEAVAGYIGCNQVVDALSLTDWYAFDIITYIVFGPNHGTRCIERPCPERNILMGLKKLQFVGPARLCFPTTYKYLSSFLERLGPFSYLSTEDVLAEWCRRRMSEAMEDPLLLSSRSLLRQLLETREHGETKTLDHDYIAAELLDNINAAEATVAVTATYLIWLLSSHRQWQQRIRDEVSALTARSGSGFLSFEDVNSRVPSLEACLLETYRLYPAISGRSERIVGKGGCTIAGVHIPENTIATSSALTLHREETYFSDSERFVPERWFEGDGATLKERTAQLIPFGYGARICLGKALATMEIKMLIAKLYLNYESFAIPLSKAESMVQSSTNDAMPMGLKCMVRFQSCGQVANPTANDV